MERPTEAELPDLLEALHDQYNRPAFIAQDPISVPRRFSKREDVEISGFFAATLAWGQRPTILNSANKLMQLMGDEPHRFVLEASEEDLQGLSGFVHRTLNGTDAVYFVRALRAIYEQYGNLEGVFAHAVTPDDEDISKGLIALHTQFFALPGAPERTRKHVANIQRGSSAKRLNMFLRWMVRNDNRGVDFGLWQRLAPRQLLCPLDVHTGRVARYLGLLHRKQNDFRACLELTEALRVFDPDDPVRFDIALFGLGASGMLPATA